MSASRLENLSMKSPAQIQIVRTAIPCPDVPREVGDGMEMEDTGFVKHSVGNPASPPRVVESRASSGYSTPVVLISNQKPVQMPLSQRSDDALSLRDSIPSPTPSDPLFMRNDKFLVEEKAALKDHLRIQVQVNQELKRLLVASIGEDMGYHYERLATEKAQIEIENEDLKKNLMTQEEETERLNISCDVWRSKFLAGRVQCDELQESVIAAQRRQREMETAVRALIREHRTRTEHLDEIRDTLSHLRDALQWGKGSGQVAKQDESNGPVDEQCLKLSHTISSRLLGSFPPAQSKSAGYKKYLQSWNKIAGEMSSSSEPEYEVKATMAEKYVTQLLQETYSGAVGTAVEQRPQDRRQSGTVAGRFHVNARHDNLTLACCSRCTGDIHVV